MAKGKPTLLRGADGSMYFIPGEQLESYRVADDKAREVAAKLEGGDDAEVSGFSFDKQMSPTSMGLDNPVAPSMDNSETVIIGSMDSDFTGKI